MHTLVYVTEYEQSSEINVRCINDHIKIPSIIDMQKDKGEIKTSWMGEHIVGEEETRWERRRATIDTREL